jgi:hypothetical protein
MGYLAVNLDKIIAEYPLMRVITLKVCSIMLFLSGELLAGCSLNTPPLTSTSTVPTVTAAFTSTSTHTPSPTSTLTASITSTSTNTPTITPNPTITPTVLGGSSPLLAFIGEDSQSSFGVYTGELYTGVYRKHIELVYDRYPDAPDFIVGPEWSYSREMSWSPDGMKLLFNNGAWQNDSIKLLNITTGKIIDIFPISKHARISELVWSPAGDFAAFELDEETGSFGLFSSWIVGMDGNAWNITSKKLGLKAQLYGWGKNSQSFFFRDVHYERTILEYNPYTQSTRNFYYIPSRNLVSGWFLPEIKSIVAEKLRDDPDCPYEYLIHSIDDDQTRLICDIPRFNFGASFAISPDRNWLVIYGWGLRDEQICEHIGSGEYRCDNPNIEQENKMYIVKIESLDSTPLPPEVKFPLAWSPDGKGLLAFGFKPGGITTLLNLQYTDWLEYRIKLKQIQETAIQFCHTDLLSCDIFQAYSLPSEPLMLVEDFWQKS